MSLRNGTGRAPDQTGGLPVGHNPFARLRIDRQSPDASMTAFDQILRWFDHHNVSPATVTATIGLLVVAFILIAIVNRLLRGWLRLLETRISMPYQTVLTVTRVISALLWLLTLMILLD